MSPELFCANARGELYSESANDGWERGARAVCELYADLDASRFETVLTSLATGRGGSALAEGARWLLPRWKAAV